MSIADNIRIKQDFDPEGENGGYNFKSGLEKVMPAEGFAVGGYIEDIYRDMPFVKDLYAQFTYKSGTLVGRDDAYDKVPITPIAKKYKAKLVDLAKGYGKPDPRLTDADGKVLQPRGIGEITDDAKARHIGKVAALAAGYGARDVGRFMKREQWATTAATEKVLRERDETKVNTALDEDANAPLSLNDMRALYGFPTLDRDDFSVEANRRRYIKD